MKLIYPCIAAMLTISAGALNQLVRPRSRDDFRKLRGGRIRRSAGPTLGSAFFSFLIFSASGGFCQSPPPVSFYEGITFAAGGSAQLIAKGDFNGDGKADLAVPNWVASGSVSVLLGNGDGTFQAPVSYPVGSYAFSVAVGDFNGDGKLDLAVTNENSNSVSILLGNGDGTFQAAVNYSVGTNPTGVAVGDFNGDRKLDLAVANYSGNVSVLLGNGDGTFKTAVNYAVGTNTSWVAAGDFNGDGKPDLAVANVYSNNVSVLLGNGDGTFQAAVNYGAGSSPRSVTVGDFNGDGKLDMAVADCAEYGGTPGVSILLGNGDGTFQTAVSYNAGAVPASVAVGDFNGDGKLDLAVPDYGSNTVGVLAGNGDGTFQTAVNYAVGSEPISAIVGDFNGDGKLDLAVEDFGTGDVTLLLNNSGTETCSYSLSSAGQSFTAAGGLGSFDVTTDPACLQHLKISAGWITLAFAIEPIAERSGPVTYPIHYAVASNTGAARNGSISVGGQTYSISQAGFSCTDTISPTFADPQDTGGNVAVSVGAPSGCSWTAVSNVAWVTVKSGGSGSGGGVVVLNVAPNTGGSRAGTVTIAGQTFSVTQGGGACGALDVTSEMAVARSGLTWLPFSTYLYSGTITVTNLSGGVMAGPVYLVTLGLPNNKPSPNGDGLIGSQLTTSCFSSPGDYLLPVPGGSMQPGQSVKIPLVFFSQSLSAPISYSTKVLSGLPSH